MRQQHLQQLLKNASPSPHVRRPKVYFAGADPRRVGVRTEGFSTPLLTFEHLDLRCAATLREASKRMQTIGALLGAGLPPADEAERGSPSDRLSAHDGAILIRDCIVDADIPLALDNATLVLIASDVRGFGHVPWAEFGMRRAAVGRTRTALVSTFRGPLIVSATAGERPDKRDEEYAATCALASALNSRDGTHYNAERMPPDAWEDGVLRSAVHGEATVPIQVRHFSDQLAKLLRGPQRSLINHDVGFLGKVIQSAIDHKTRVDSELRAKAHLVLISPIPLGQIKRAEIAALSFTNGGYADVWLYPFGEEPYSLLR